MIVERFVLNYSLSHGKTRINLITQIFFIHLHVVLLAQVS